MGTGEIYLPLYVGFPNDPKVRALARYGSPDAGLARDLYVQMCLYCKSELTDGWVPAEQVGLLVYPLDLEHGNQLAKQLASVGLTNELSKNEAPGWQVVAFLRRNRSREQVDDLSNKRAIAGATGGRKSRKRAGQSVSQSKAKQPASNLLSNLPPKDRVRDRGTTTELSNESSAANESRPEPNPGPVVAAYVEGAETAGLKRPATSLCARVGKQARQLLNDGFPAEALIASARTMGAGEWNDLAVQVRKDDAAANSRAGSGESKGSQRARQAIAAGEELQNMIDEGRYPA